MSLDGSRAPRPARGSPPTGRSCILHIKDQLVPNLGTMIQQPGLIKGGEPRASSLHGERRFDPDDHICPVSHLTISLKIHPVLVRLTFRKCLVQMQQPVNQYRKQISTLRKECDDRQELCEMLV